MIYLFVEYNNNNNNKEIFIQFKKYNSRNKIFLLKEEFIISMYMAFDWYKLWKGNKRYCIKLVVVILFLIKFYVDRKWWFQRNWMLNISEWHVLKKYLYDSRDTIPGK